MDSPIEICMLETEANAIMTLQHVKMILVHQSHQLENYSQGGVDTPHEPPCQKKIPENDST